MGDIPKMGLKDRRARVILILLIQRCNQLVRRTKGKLGILIDKLQPVGEMTEVKLYDSKTKFKLGTLIDEVRPVGERTDV